MYVCMCVCLYTAMQIFLSLFYFLKVSWVGTLFLCYVITNYTVVYVNYITLQSGLQTVRVVSLYCTNSVSSVNMLVIIFMFSVYFCENLYD